MGDVPIYNMMVFVMHNIVVAVDDEILLKECLRIYYILPLNRSVCSAWKFAMENYVKNYWLKKIIFRMFKPIKWNRNLMVEVPAYFLIIGF